MKALKTITQRAIATAQKEQVLSLPKSKRFSDRKKDASRKACRGKVQW